MRQPGPAAEPLTETPGQGRTPLYAAVARAVTGDIVSGRYPVGSVIPTELALTQRYGVSRQTVRQALNELKQQGLISSHAGVGTTVRARPQAPRFMSGLGAISELLQFVGSTRTRVRREREVIADEKLAAILKCEVGQAWWEMQCLRESREAEAAVGHVVVYVRAEHAQAVAGMDVVDSPFYTLLEKRFGVRVVEVAQEIEAARLTAEMARELGASPRAASLKIVRHYYDKDARLTQVSIGHYPEHRYKQTTRFRATASAEDAGL